MTWRYPSAQRKASFDISEVEELGSVEMSPLGWRAMGDDVSPPVQTAMVLAEDEWRDLVAVAKQYLATTQIVTTIRNDRGDYDHIYRQRKLCERIIAATE
jgi:2,4-dienoyl-CoA reductase-like NADH-dependent reductase (Old Yellow Enzyme family)